jgi:predicted dehydrogenase
LVEQGWLGRPLVVQISCFWNRDSRYYQAGGASSWRGDYQLDAGILFTQFSHFIDLLIALWGPPTPLQATLRNLSHPGLPLPDAGTATLQLPGGGLGGLTFTTAVPGVHAENRIAIVAERGSLVLSGQYFERLEWAELPAGAPAFVPPAGGAAGDAAAARMAGHRAVWADVLAALADGPPYPERLTATLTDGAAGVQVIERIHALAGLPLTNAAADSPARAEAP